MKKFNEMISAWNCGSLEMMPFFVTEKGTFFPGKTEVFEGRVDGKIIEEKRGDNGFGFDPIFVPDGFEKTFAEMSAEEKKKISHRGRALEKFLRKVFDGQNI